jgi:hypothetical protein
MDLVWGRGRNFLTNQDEVLLWGGKGVLGESWMNKRFFWVIFHPVKAQEAQEMHICPKARGLQNSNVNSVGWNNICLGPSCIFVILWGTCDSSVLQCRWFKIFVQFSALSADKMQRKTSSNNIWRNAFFPYSQYTIVTSCWIKLSRYSNFFCLNHTCYFATILSAISHKQ